MSRHSYYRSKGYSTGEMLSEGKLDVWELPVREPRWLRDEEEEDDNYPSTEEIEEMERRAYEAIEIASPDSNPDDDGEF